MVDTYRARRRIQMAPGVFREPDDLLPEAAAWVRVDAYVHGGFITKAEVTEAEFSAAVKKFCPEQSDWLTDLADLNQHVNLYGPHNSPRGLIALDKPAQVKPVPAKPKPPVKSEPAKSEPAKSEPAKAPATAAAKPGPRKGDSKAR